MKTIIPSALIALGIVILGLCMKWGIDDFTNKDRKVVVKGLSEKEVDADKVTWPIVSKELGNDLPDLYHRIAVTQASIKRFLKAGGVADSEITVNAPVVIDLNADQYSDNRRSYRYNITSIITVTSRNVAQVRNLIARQGELLKDGIAIVSGDYENRIRYEYVSFKAMKPKRPSPTQRPQLSSLPTAARASSARLSVQTKDSSLLRTATKTRLT